MSTPAVPFALFVGVDIAAATATAAWLIPGAAPKKPISFDQTPAGFATLQRHLAATGVSPRPDPRGFGSDRQLLDPPRRGPAHR